MCNSFLAKVRGGEWSLKLFTLICLFGWSSWIDINGVFVELPILVTRSPQGWNLPSYISVVIQLANVGPLFYILSSKYLRIRGRKLVTETPAIFFIISIGIASSFILAFTWHRTTVINGQEYSTALISLSFALAFVDCMSSVTFLPFMAYFPQKYITAYYVGGGLSGLLPGIAALIQGIGGKSYKCKTVTKYVNVSMTDVFHGNYLVEPYRLKEYNETVPVYSQTNPRFSVKVFFFIITAMLVSSLLAFIELMRMKKRYVSEATLNKYIENKETKSGSAHIVIQNKSVDHEMEEAGDIFRATSNSVLVNEKKRTLSLKTVCFLLLLNGVITGLSNGVLPSLNSYACLPYGKETYHLAATLSKAFNPLACFMYFFVSMKSIKSIFAGVLVYLTCAGYIIGIASTSPCPILVDSKAGGIIMLIVIVFSVGLVSYLKTAISSVLQQQGHKVLLWCGISTQVGSFISAVTMFPLVSIYGLFHSSKPCRICPY